MSLGSAAGVPGTITFDVEDDSLTSNIAYITASGYGSGINVHITGLRYGDSPPEPVTVPEPMSAVGMLLGCVGIGVLRRRFA